MNIFNKSKIFVKKITLEKLIGLFFLTILPIFLIVSLFDAFIGIITKSRKSTYLSQESISVEKVNLHEHEFKRKQKEIYDGTSSEYIPFYYDLKSFKDAVSWQIGAAEKWGIFIGDLKEAKNKIIFDNLEFKEGDNVLDVGCGSGNLLNILNTLYGIEGTGIDIAPLAIKRATEFNPCQNKVLIADAENLPFKANSFEYVISLDVLEHIPHPTKCISEMSRILKNKGKVMFYAISKKDKYSWHWILRKLTSGKLGVDITGGHNRDNFLVPLKVIHALKSNNLKLEAIIYFHSLYTLIIDECFPERILLISHRLRLMHFILYTSELADRILSTRGYSNGFYVIAKKINWS